MFHFMRLMQGNQLTLHGCIQRAKDGEEIWLPLSRLCGKLPIPANVTSNAHVGRDAGGESNLFLYAAP